MLAVQYIVVLMAFAAIKSAFVMRDIMGIGARVWTDAMALIVVPNDNCTDGMCEAMEATVETDAKRLMYAMESHVVLMELVD